MYIYQCFNKADTAEEDTIEEESEEQKNERERQLQLEKEEYERQCAVNKERREVLLLEAEEKIKDAKEKIKLWDDYHKAQKKYRKKGIEISYADFLYYREQEQKENKGRSNDND